MSHVPRFVKNVVFALLSVAWVSYSAADEIRVLSAGAIEPGLRAVAVAF